MFTPLLPVWAEPCPVSDPLPLLIAVQRHLRHDEELEGRPAPVHSRPVHSRPCPLPPPPTPAPATPAPTHSRPRPLPPPSTPAPSTPAPSTYVRSTGGSRCPTVSASARNLIFPSLSEYGNNSCLAILSSRDSPITQYPLVLKEVGCTVLSVSVPSGRPTGTRTRSGSGVGS